ncbi:peptidylprolyl isomerase [Pseudoalteromonas sp. YIC-656]|uniref:peptidylprolyl isomerase n=1 Tax=Pseudoalteromonas pernae TaxID=3118054 RepID=UPI003242085F
MIKKSIALALATMIACAHATDSKVAALSPTQIIDSAPAEDWRFVAPENMLVLTLPTGQVLMEMNTRLTPAHHHRLTELAAKHFYKDLSMYRFVEGFVAQGGAGEETTQVPTLQQEFVKHTDKRLALDIVVNEQDGYAARSGFLDGFAVAQNAQGTQTWQTHCIGALGMARGNEIDSGTSEFYVVIGHAPRYLDRNITVFGRVLAGMEHLQRLQRPGSTDKPFNKITDMVLASQLPVEQQPQVKVMRTDSDSFAALVEARKNRPESWFVTTPNYIDTCAMQVPTITGG